MDPNAIRIVDIPHEDVVACNITNLQRLFGSIQDRPENARFLRHKVVVGFSSFDADPRPNHLIPEIRSFVRALDAALPHFVYFLAPDPAMGHLAFYLFCLLDPKDGAFDSRSLARLLRKKAAAIEQFSKTIADDTNRAVAGLLLNIPPEMARDDPERCRDILRAYRPTIEAIAESTRPPSGFTQAQVNQFEEEVLARAAAFARVERGKHGTRAEFAKAILDATPIVPRMHADAHIAVTGSCRRCGAAVMASAKPGPVYRCMADCDRCHYRTILRDDPIDLPLTEALKPFLSAEEIESTLGQSDVVSAFIAVVQRGFDKISEFLQEYREVAIAGLLDLMDRREQLLRHRFTDRTYNEMTDPSAAIDVAICQTLYFLLLQHGPIVLPDRPVSASMRTIFRQQTFPLLGDLVAILKMVPTLTGGLARLHYADGQLRFEKLEKHSLMVESGINMLLQEERDGRDAPPPKIAERRGLIVSEPCRRALALATGVDVAFLTELLKGRMQRLIDQRVGIRRGEIVHISSALLTQQIDAIFRKLMLDLGTIQRFRAPCFFDTGPLRTSATSPAFIAETTAINWTAYYPCYVAQSSLGGKAVYLTSPRTWQGMLMSLAQRPAYAVHQAHESVAGDPTRRQDVAELRTLVRETHREIEALAGQAARNAGWRCRTSVEALGSTPLPEGEIDLLATANVGDRSVILLAEVKNSDNPLFVPGFSERVAALVTHADTQLRRKGSWIAEHWGETLNFLGHAAVSSKRHRRRLLRVIITARPLAVHHFRQFPGTSVAGFRSLASDLLQVDHDVWESPWRIHWTEIAQ